MNADPSTATDIELEQHAAAGDRDAFGALYERYSPRVHDFLLRMVREPAEAADLMQETFVRAMRSMKEERAGKAEFSTWLFTIARNLALSRLERAKRTEPLTDDEGEDDAAFFRLDPDRLDNPETAAESREVVSLVWQASEALEPKQRTLLDLHVRQGLDSAEIAVVLGVSKGNAYTMVSRLKDTFESAVAGLIMFRDGRRSCPELNQLLEEHGAVELSPGVRKLIERHTQSCERCQGKRRELVSASALLRALVPLPLAPDIAARVHDAAWAQAQLTGATVAGASAGGSSAGQTGGLLSLPARTLHALPGPAWLPAAVAAAIVAVSVPVALFSMRSDGPSSSDDAAAAQRAVVAAQTSPAAAPTAADVNYDGDYTIALAPGDERCGLPSIHGLRLAVEGDSATLTSGSGEVLSGSAITQDGRLSLHLGIIREQGSEWVVDLSGVLDDSGNIRGDSESAGVFPGGRTGFACNYPFTANRASIDTATSEACPNAEALFAVWRVSSAASASPGVTGFTNISCWSTWVVASALGNVNGRVQFSTLPTLGVVDVAEIPGFIADVCASADAPSDWHLMLRCSTDAAPPVPPAPDAGSDADRLRAAIRALSPDVGLESGCAASLDRPCATGSWPPEALATGIAEVIVDNGQVSFVSYYGRMADGTWVYWFGTQNTGGPQVKLPGAMIVCADGDGLNLRTEPSTGAAVVTLIPDGAMVQGDRFVMTDPPSASDNLPPHPDGWYHVTSPQEGWAYDRYLLAYENGGVRGCIDTWWP